MKNIKLYEKLKEVKGKKVALIAGGILTGALVIAGCTTQVVVDPNTGEVTVTEQQPTEPEVIETADPVEEVVEETPVEEVVEEAEEYPMPEFILRDENGDAYVPQHVTADDIYNKIAEMEETGVFANDWERDVYVYNLLYFNVYYMDLNEAKAITNDYLSNALTTNVYESAAMDFAVKGKIELKDYFIDERLSAEAEKFDNYVSNNCDMEELVDNYKKTVSDLLNYDDDNYFTSLNEMYDKNLDLYLDIEYMMSDDYYSYLEYACKKTGNCQELSLPIPSGNDTMFSPNSYESSHIENQKRY